MINASHAAFVTEFASKTICPMSDTAAPRKSFLRSMFTDYTDPIFCGGRGSSIF